jgi:hypothetical protein
MAKQAKSLSYYPANYAVVIRNAIQGNKEQGLDLPDRAQANRLRGQFYAYVGVLKREAASLGLQSELRRLAESEQEVMELALLSTKLMISIEDKPEGGVLVKFTNREQSWQAQAIASIRTLGEIPPAKRLLEDGSVMDENQLADMNMAISMIQGNVPGAEEMVANIRQNCKHWLAHSPELVKVIAAWEAERSLTHQPISETEKHVADRLASYGAKMVVKP